MTHLIPFWVAQNLWGQSGPVLQCPSKAGRKSLKLLQGGESILMAAAQLHLRLPALGKVRTWVKPTRNRVTATERSEAFSGTAHTTKLLLWNKLWSAAGWQKPPRHVMESCLPNEESCGIFFKADTKCYESFIQAPSLWASKILKCKHLQKVLTLTHMLKYSFQVLLWMYITKTLPVLSSRIWTGTVLPEWLALLWISGSSWTLLMFW